MSQVPLAIPTEEIILSPNISAASAQSAADFKLTHYRAVRIVWQFPEITTFTIHRNQSEESSFKRLNDVADVNDFNDEIGMEKYDQIGVGYNNTRKADHYLLGRMMHFLRADQNGTYLDIGCGTGNYTIEFSKRGVKMIGIDPSEAMLSIARTRNNVVDWRNGKAESMNLAEASVDGVLAVLTTHHWTNQDKGYAELGRVMKPGSRLVIFTATPEQMRSYWLSHYFPTMLRDSGKHMLPYETIEANLHKAGFSSVSSEKYFVTNDLQDLFLQSGKCNPAIYLDEQVRRGISSFATAKNADEVANGLHLLREDVATGKIEEVMKKYESEIGDYLFVAAQK